MIQVLEVCSGKLVPSGDGRRSSRASTSSAHASGVRPEVRTVISGAEGGGWSSRALVNLAAGMVMSQLRVCAGDALAVLRSHAFATDAQLADVARQVVDRRLDLSAS
jgi:hypothetical protein